MITQITLQAREESRPPVGVHSSTDRDIGFADVFVTLENPTTTDTRITIQRIEIQDSHNHQVYLTMPAAQEIHLRPAEVSIHDLHLTNKTGYPGQHPVKAIVTYQVQGSDRVIESSPVEINRR